jgi:capsular exopolysaccharide synthesis family protein
MELRDYLRILRKNWLLILVATLLGIGLAAAWSFTRTPLYEAKSEVFVSTQPGGTVSELQQGNSFSLARVTTYVSLVTTPIVLDTVIADLELETSSGSLAAQVTASSPLNTTLVQITVSDPDPQKAADLANAVAASLTSTVQDIETPAGESTSPIKLTRVRDASVPTAPVSPNVSLNLALGVLIGLALGVGGAVLRNVLDNKVRSPRDVEQVTDRPLIGTIPFDSKAAERPIILQADPHNARAESFRALRTNLQFLEMDGGNSFVITSSLPSDGKSTTAVNLAIALADAGQRVALIDGDLRKPKVATYLSIEGGAGLTDVLIGRAKLDDVMLPWGDRPLHVLPAGKVPPNPSELLGSNQMTELLADLSARFDVVLLDSAPLLPVTDGAVLAKLTSGAILVVASGRTTTHQLDSAIDVLDTVGARVAGVVLTKVPTKGADAYGYGYGYGYGGYGSYTAPPAVRENTLRSSRRRSSGLVQE